MTCSEARPLLDAYFDSELDLAASLEVEKHIAGCEKCSSVLANLQQLRDELTPSVFHRLTEPDRKRIEASVRRATHVHESWNRPSVWAAVAAVLLIAIVPMWWQADAMRGFQRELVDNHVRSLMAEHLVDVPSSDQHTVKPWFQGKVDFAPDVPDFAAEGFALVGGRLDMLGGRQTAVIVYKRRGHFINLSTSRTGSRDAPTVFSTVDGYQIGHWSTAGLERWVVSDLNRAELQKFAELFRGR